MNKMILNSNTSDAL